MSSRSEQPEKEDVREQRAKEQERLRKCEEEMANRKQKPEPKRLTFVERNRLVGEMLEVWKHSRMFVSTPIFAGSRSAMVRRS